MIFDSERFQQGKTALRRRLARLPIAEKLALLEVLRERAVTIRRAAVRDRLHNSVELAAVSERTGSASRH